MEKKRIGSLFLAGMISVGALTGCTKKDDSLKNDNGESIESVGKEYFEQIVEEPKEARVFEPGEHVFFVRYFYGNNADYISSGRVEVPDGYEIIEIENVVEWHGSGSRTSGVDIWYQNTETVEVNPVFKHEHTSDGYWDFYDYSRPGTVIEKLEENGPTLSKKIEK